MLCCRGTFSFLLSAELPPISRGNQKFKGSLPYSNVQEDSAPEEGMLSGEVVTQHLESSVCAGSWVLQRKTTAETPRFCISCCDMIFSPDTGLPESNFYF